MKPSFDISVVVPIYNEESNIKILYSELSKALKGITPNYEILFVDDGSQDTSFSLMSAISAKDKNVKVIRFRKNFGQSAAIGAGFENSSGSVIVVMDGDLQNDPNDIKLLLKKMDEGYDVVSGWRFARKDPISKTIPSRLSNFLHYKLTGVNIHDSGCSLKAYSRKSVESLELYGEMHRFIPALLAARGFKIGEVKVTHKPRIHGISKYGFKRLGNGMLDLFYVYFWTKYSTKPLHFFGVLGIIPIIIGLLLGIYKSIDAAIALYFKREVLFVGPLMLFSVFLIIIGILFILFGFLAEMNLRLFYPKSGKKAYEIYETRNL